MKFFGKEFLILLIFNKLGKSSFEDTLSFLKFTVL